MTREARTGGGLPQTGATSWDAADSAARDPLRLEEYGLSEALVGEIEARERRQLHLFLTLAGAGAAAAWIVFTALVYAHSFHRAPYLGLVMAPLLALLGAAIAALPIAIACGFLVLLVLPRHPKARALERYEAATHRMRTCDVCVLVRGDGSIKADVAFCARCDAWLCPDCRNRYDLRAIAALKARVPRAVAPAAGRGGPGATPP